MEITSQLKKGALEMCVLALVSRQDSYGYELVAAISNHFDVGEGTIYPILRRLTRENYFATYLAESTEGPPRKYYRIKPSGKKRLQELCEQWHGFSHAVNEIISEDRDDKKTVLAQS